MDVKNGSAYVLTFFSLISDGQGSLNDYISYVVQSDLTYFSICTFFKVLKLNTTPKWCLLPIDFIVTAQEL